MSIISLTPSISHFLAQTRLSPQLSTPFLFACHSRKKRKIRSMSAWLKQALSQRLNPSGVASFAEVVARDPQLALPHIAVPDIRWVDWSELERLGFRGVVFDKDNTLTGLYQYDPDGSEAIALEESIGGIHVIRHENKKPAGTAEEIEKHFGCSASLLVMVGDRHFTDVVYGNKNGFLTILTEPLSLSEEPFIVKQVRRLESFLVNRWYQKGLKPAKHSLLSETNRCVKAPSL